MGIADKIGVVAANECAVQGRANAGVCLGASNNQMPDLQAR